MVLIQWEGLHSDETLWEDWASLKEAYHLEDKVLPNGVGNDGPKFNDQMSTRPKKVITTPRYLRD